MSDLVGVGKDSIHPIYAGFCNTEIICSGAKDDSTHNTFFIWCNQELLEDSLKFLSGLRWPAIPESRGIVSPRGMTTEVTELM
jgi:hypothetical protein